MKKEQNQFKELGTVELARLAAAVLEELGSNRGCRLVDWYFDSQEGQYRVELVDEIANTRTWY